MLRLGVLLLLLNPMYSVAQSVSATVTVTPNFTFNTTTALETAAATSPTTQVSNSFYITVDNNNVGACNVYAALESPGITTSSVTPMAASTVVLRFSTTTASASNYTYLNTADIPMTVYGGTGSPGTLILTQKKSNTSYRYTYHVRLPKMGYVYAPGTYNYTFRITMSVP